MVYNTHCAVCFGLCVFVMCTLSCQILWIVHASVFSNVYLQSIYLAFLIIISIQNIIMELNLNRSSLVDCNKNMSRGDSGYD